MKKIALLMFLCTFCFNLTGWAQTPESVHKVVVKLKDGTTKKYDSDKIERISFDTEQRVQITVDEVNTHNFTFSIVSGGRPYLFAAFETGYLNIYTQDMLLAQTGHEGLDDETYYWIDGQRFEDEGKSEIMSVKPNTSYTILSCFTPEPGMAPDRIERVDFMTKAEEQSQAVVNVELKNIDRHSVTVKSDVASPILSYIIFIKEKTWVDDVLKNYGEETLRRTTENAVNYQMARIYEQSSEEVWDNLTPGTEYCCILVITDADGKKKMEIKNFNTLD